MLNHNLILNEIDLEQLIPNIINKLKVIFFTNLVNDNISKNRKSLEILLKLLKYLINNKNPIYHLIILLLNKILKIISILFNILYCYLILKFSSSQKLYPKRDRSPDNVEGESSAWKKRQDDIQEAEMDLKDIKEDLKEVDNASKFHNNPSLPVEAKAHNSHLKHVEDVYREFFDGQDDSDHTNRGLRKVYNYLLSQKEEKEKELKELKKTPNEALDDILNDDPTDMFGDE